LGRECSKNIENIGDLGQKPKNNKKIERAPVVALQIHGEERQSNDAFGGFLEFRFQTIQ
jgi:hypothetical protein